MSIALPQFDPQPGSQIVVRVSDLRQWTYCPRVVWWTQVCPVGKVVSFKMKRGQSNEAKMRQLQKRRSLKAFELERGRFESSVQLDSPELGLSGKLDFMIRDGSNLFPVEVKYTFGEAQLNHRIQLAGYALLIEAIFNVPVPHGFLVRLPEDVVERISIDGPLRELTLQTIGSIRSMIHQERIPNPNPVTQRCIDCEYRLFCRDIAIDQLTGQLSQTNAILVQ